MTKQKGVSLWPDPAALGLVTDLYQLTMMAGYVTHQMHEQPATFELFVRRLPANRSFLIFAGLEQAIDDVVGMRFSEEQVAYVRNLPAFAHIGQSFFDYLTRYRFTGNIFAAREGTAVFAGEPLVRVEAPLAEAQLIETYLLASLNYPTLVASKAARMVLAARGRSLYDFGTRRGHGPHTGFLCARASYLAGFAATSNVEAARRLGIPCVGTMAHSWVSAFPTEREAFAAFVAAFPENSTMLVDTYDTEAGVRTAATIEPPIQAIRLDSGDLGTLAKSARKILDGAGRRETRILASSDLDEWKIDELVRENAPIDAFGVGTQLITSRDQPASSMVYKLVLLNGVGRIKLSPGKKTYPLAKQIHRRTDRDGRFAGDFITRSDEAADGESLLVQVVRNGERVDSAPSLTTIRDHATRQLAALPNSLIGLNSDATYPLTYSDALEDEAVRLGVKQSGAVGR